MAIFFTSLLPQFAPADMDPFIAMFLLGLCFSTMTMFWLTLYSVVIARADAFFRAPNVRKVLDGITEVALCSIGFHLVFGDR